MGKIRIVWICHFSNNQIRKRLNFEKYTLWALVRKLFGRTEVSDFAVWNTNAIREFEKFDDLELHVISPHYYISSLQEFEMNGVYYHFFKSEDDNLHSLIRSRLLRKPRRTFSKNARLINNLIDHIRPDIIHMIGAENPYYGVAALTIPKDIPFIVSLQTLMCDPNFFDNYPISQSEYDYRVSVEKAIIKRADYVGSKVESFKKIILKEISPDISFLDMTLAVGEDINIDNNIKSYDFVYFAADISKAADYAIEAFAIAKESYPDITLHIVGGYSETYISSLKSRMQELGLGREVDFTGKLPTHDDVILEIRKARFALLPLKIDLISGTIREAMSNYIPVITTITPATPDLNSKRESLLLSEKGDFFTMAENMCKLLSDNKYAQLIKENAVITLGDIYNNSQFMNKWRESYRNIINNK